MSGSAVIVGVPPPRGWHTDRRRARRRLLIALGVVLVLAGAAIVTYVAWPRGWRLAWHDEFSGSSVRSSGWNVRNDTYLPYENSILTSSPANVRVGDGVLTIEARREQRSVGRTTRQYTSGYLDTIGKHSWKYGRFEMRAKLPVAEGLWPAFWLRADHGLGEIDVMEAIGGIPRLAQQSVIRSTTDGREKQVNRYYLPTGTIGGWHVYAAEVSAGKISFSVDGKRVFTVTAKRAPWIGETFDGPLNIRLNLQVGGSLPNYYRHPLTAGTQLPASYEIDWVRVYQRR